MKATGRSQQSGGRARVCRKDGVSTMDWGSRVVDGCTAGREARGVSKAGKGYTSATTCEFCKWQSSGLRQGDGFGARESSGRWEIDIGMHGEGYYRSRRCGTRLKEAEIAGKVGRRRGVHQVEPAVIFMGRVGEMVEDVEGTGPSCLDAGARAGGH